MIENPGPAGVYHVLVKAFVKVQDSYVFNGGRVATISWSGNKEEQVDDSKVSVNVIGEKVETLQPPPNVTRVTGEASESIIAAFPAFTPSQSFYSAEYPSVINPFMPQPTPDGRMAPALLTDDGITETVARVSKKWEGRRKPLKKSEVVLAKAPQSGLQKGPASFGVKTPSQEQYEKPSAGSAREVKKLVTPQKAIDKIPNQGVKEQQGTDSSEAPKNKNSDLFIYLIAGFIVLAFIYFIFQKEEKMRFVLLLTTLMATFVCSVTANMNIAGLPTTGRCTVQNFGKTDGNAAIIPNAFVQTSISNFSATKG